MALTRAHEHVFFIYSFKSPSMAIGRCGILINLWDLNDEHTTNTRNANRIYRQQLLAHKYMVHSTPTMPFHVTSRYLPPLPCPLPISIFQANHHTKRIVSSFNTQLTSHSVTCGLWTSTLVRHRIGVRNSGLHIKITEKPS